MSQHYNLKQFARIDQNQEYLLNQIEVLKNHVKELNSVVQDISETLNQTVQNEKSVWKLLCYDRNNINKEFGITFQGSAKELSDHINKINQNNYSYVIMDFKCIKGNL